MRGLWHSLVFRCYFLMFWVRSALRLEQQSQPVLPSTDSSGSAPTGDGIGSLETSMMDDSCRYI